VRVDDHRARFLAHQQPAEEVPGRVVGVDVDEAVDPTVGDVAQGERTRAQRPELLPWQRARRHARERDHAVLGPRDRRRPYDAPVARRAFTPDSREVLAGRLVRDQGAPRAVTVERTERDRPVRDVTGAVRRSVDRVDDDRDRRVVGSGPPGLLAQDAEAARRERAEHGGIGDHVERVLARDLRARATRRAFQGGERDVLGVRSSREEREDVVGRHGTGVTSTVVV
jgi:hypothetical protein